MSTHHLDKVFRPERIAVIGASARPGTVGATVLHNLYKSGFEGVVDAVNPSHSTIDGQPVWPDVASLPKAPDLAIVCTPAATVPQLVRECGQAGVPGMVILSAGFRETGEQGRALEEQIGEEARRFRGLRIIGPNCLGIIVPGSHMNASFATQLPAPGRLAFISQSGALCTAILDWAVQKGIGFSHFISIGNMLDVDLGDLIDYLGQQPEVRSIMLYAESVTNARKFMSAARAFARIKPIVAYKSGRFAQSAKAAASHTGAMAGEDRVVDAAFERAGIERCYEVDDMFDCAELLAWQRTPTGSRLAIVTNAGGPGVMAADALLARGGELATLSSTSIDELNAALPAYWSHGNPVDVLGDAPADRYRTALKVVIKDQNVDGVLAVLTPQAMTDATATAEAVAELAAGSSRPILASWMGGATVEPGNERLNKSGIPTYENPGQAVRAFMHLVSYGRNRDVLYEVPREVPNHVPLDHAALRAGLAHLTVGPGGLIPEHTCKSLLAACGIATAKTVAAGSLEETIASARQIGFPVAIKILSPDVSHKSDVGGVELALRNEDDLRLAWRRLMTSVTKAAPQARVEGVAVQEMIEDTAGYELILGAKKDPTFGSVLLVGMGGVTAEVLNDLVLGLPPLNELLARRMLEKLRSWPLLLGYRRRPGVDVDQLIDVLIRFSYLVANAPEIKEFDINPLLAGPRRIVALDARAIRDESVSANARPFEHLAIRPYPEGFDRDARLKNGLKVHLRPIRPEDEPLWHAMIANCSLETIRARFRYSFKQTTHEMASRFCFIDYDREMAIVAEVDGKNGRQLAAVARLVSDPEHETAEYAVLVGDAWQGQGLGRLLTEYCLEVAKTWELRRVVAITDRANSRMIATFERVGFELTDDPVEGAVRASKQIG